MQTAPDIPDQTQGVALNAFIQQAALELCRARNEEPDGCWVRSTGSQTFRELAERDVRAVLRSLAPITEPLLHATFFYARREHWMAQTENAEDQRLLVAQDGQTSGTDGWQVAVNALAQVNAAGLLAQPAEGRS